MSDTLRVEEAAVTQFFHFSFYSISSMHVVSACPVCADGKGAKREAGRCAFRPARGRYIANQKNKQTRK